MKISILGAGAFGTALGGILADNGYDIDYYDSKLERERLSDNLNGAKYVILCVPSKAAPFVLPYIPTNLPLIVATKGILSDEQFSKFDDWMVLSGPGFADDIKAHKKTEFTVTDKRLEMLFDAPYVSFDLTSDRRGVLMCGALKNVYAILAGIKALKRDTSSWRRYIEDVLIELKAILLANDADAATVDLCCGVGDLKLTCGMPSRNYEYGSILRDMPEYQPTNTVEGLSAIKRIERGEIRLPSNTPILKEIIDAVK